MKADDNTSFEDKLERLRSIVERLEADDVPLEQGVALYKEGLALVEACGLTLARARHEVTVAARDGEQAYEHYLAEGGADAEGDADGSG